MSKKMTNKQMLLELKLAFIRTEINRMIDNEYYEEAERLENIWGQARYNWLNSYRENGMETTFDQAEAFSQVLNYIDELIEEEKS